MGLVFQQGGYYDPVVVAIIACAGWSLGDTGIYVAGAVGSVSVEKQAPAPGRFRAWLSKLMDTLERFMRTHGTLAVGVLAAVTFIPNPIAGATLLAAGANRMRPSRFLSGVVVGRLVRGLILAYAGSQVVNV
jgi:membrane protein DedA with SNARE-associated domain